MSSIQQTVLFGVSAAVVYLLMDFASKGNTVYPLSPSKRPGSKLQPNDSQLAAGTSWNPPPNYYIPPYFNENFKDVKWFGWPATQDRCDAIFGKGATEVHYWMDRDVCISKKNPKAYFLFHGYI